MARYVSTLGTHSWHAACAGFDVLPADCVRSLTSQTSRVLELRLLPDGGLLPSAWCQAGCHPRPIAVQGQPHQQGQQGLELGSTTGNGLPPGGHLRRRLTHDVADLQWRRNPLASAYKPGSFDDSCIGRGNPDSSASSQAALLQGQVGSIVVPASPVASQQRVRLSWSFCPVDWAFVYQSMKPDVARSTSCSWRVWYFCVW